MEHQSTELDLYVQEENLGLYSIWKSLMGDLLPSPLRRSALAYCRPIIPSNSSPGWLGPFRHSDGLNSAVL